MVHKRKHIILLTSEFPPLPGGIGNHAYNLAEYFQESGYRVSVIADQRDALEREKDFDSKLKSEVYRIPIRTSRVLMYLKRIKITFLMAKKADLLICSGKFPLWVGAFLSAFVKIETIAVIHGSEVNFKNKWLNKSINVSLKRFSKIVAVSNYTKSLVKHLELNTIKVIPNGISVLDEDIDQIENLNLKGELKLLTVGNVTERKGQANVIKHLPELIKHFPNIHYHCVGLKTEVGKFLKLAKTLSVESYITFHGYVSRHELNAFYVASDICIMLSEETSSGDIEGFGIALLESNYFGLPTIGSRGFGIEDAIQDGKSGILVNQTNTKEIVNAINTIIDHKKEFHDHSKLWANRHQWSTIILDYINYISA